LRHFAAHRQIFYPRLSAPIGKCCWKGHSQTLSGVGYFCSTEASPHVKIIKLSWCTFFFFPVRGFLASFHNPRSIRMLILFRMLEPASSHGKDLKSERSILFFLPFIPTACDQILLPCCDPTRDFPADGEFGLQFTIPLRWEVVFVEQGTSVSVISADSRVFGPPSRRSRLYSRLKASPSTGMKRGPILRICQPKTSWVRPSPP